MSAVRLGYKRTEVGVIPEEWEVTELGTLIGSLDAGVSVRSVPSNAIAMGHDDYVLKTSCIAGGMFFPSEAKSILPEDRHRARTPVRADTILISRMNTPDLVGEVGYIAGDFDNLFLPDRLWMARRAPRRNLSMKWLAMLLAHGAAGRAIKDTATGTSGSMKNIAKPALRKLAVPCPKPEEQHAIAGALGDADALIAALEALIAKKRDIKQGTIQELLTGTRRLPGFTEPWKSVSIGDLYEFKNGLNKSKEYFGIGSPIVNYMDVYRAPLLKRSDILGRVTVTSDEMRAYGAQRGDVFFTRTSETQEEIGIASVLLEDISECVFSGFILRGRPKNTRMISEFAGYCFRTNKIRNQIIAKSSYTTRALINGRALSLVSLELPDPDEQRAIAAVLTDMDTEIAALEGKFIKAKDVRQGMMQALLTGEVRLV